MSSVEEVNPEPYRIYQRAGDDLTRVQMTSYEFNLMRHLAPMEDETDGVMEESFQSNLAEHDRTLCSPNRYVHTIDLQDSVVDGLLNVIADPDSKVPHYMQPAFESTARILSTAAQIAIEHGFEPTPPVAQEAILPSVG
jgi:hypothetical protein